MCLTFLAQRQCVHWVAGVTVHLCVPAQLFAWQTESLARTLCSWTFPSQEGITDSDHVAFVDRLSCKLKTLISNVCTLTCRNTNAPIHSHMYSQTNPVSWNKKAVSLSWGLQKFMRFSSTCFGKAGLLMKAWTRFRLWPHPGWSICLAAITHICHLLTEKNVQHSLRMHARTSFGLSIIMRQWQQPANLLCKWFKGHRNVLRGEFELISLVFEAEPESPKGGQYLWFPRNKTRGNVLIYLETWLEREGYSCTPSPQGGESVLSSH